MLWWGLNIHIVVFFLWQANYLNSINTFQVVKFEVVWILISLVVDTLEGWKCSMSFSIEVCCVSACAFVRQRAVWHEVWEKTKSASSRPTMPLTCLLTVSIPHRRGEDIARSLAAVAAVADDEEGLSERVDGVCGLLLWETSGCYLPLAATSSENFLFIFLYNLSYLVLSATVWRAEKSCSLLNNKSGNTKTTSAPKQQRIIKCGIFNMKVCVLIWLHLYSFLKC